MAACRHTGGYIARNGQLVCADCGALSPRSRLDESGNTIRIGERPIQCPKCGHIMQEQRPAEEVETKPVRLKR